MDHVSGQAVPRFSALSSNPRGQKETGRMPTSRQNSDSSTETRSTQKRTPMTPPWSPRDKPLPTPEQILFQQAEMGTWVQMQNEYKPAAETLSYFSNTSTFSPLTQPSRPSGRSHERSISQTVIQTPSKPPTTAVFGIPSPPAEEQPVRLRRNMSQSLKNIFSTTRADSSAQKLTGVTGKVDKTRRRASRRASRRFDQDDPRTMKPYNTSTISAGNVSYKSTTIRGTPRDADQCDSAKRAAQGTPAKPSALSRATTLRPAIPQSRPLHARGLSLPTRTTPLPTYTSSTGAPRTPQPMLASTPHSRAAAFQILNTAAVPGTVAAGTTRLNVAIPSPDMERYSVMFEKFLSKRASMASASGTGLHVPTTLAERRGTMTRLAPLVEIGSAPSTGSMAAAPTRLRMQAVHAHGVDADAISSETPPALIGADAGAGAGSPALGSANRTSASAHRRSLTSPSLSMRTGVVSPAAATSMGGVYQPRKLNERQRRSLLLQQQRQQKAERAREVTEEKASTVMEQQRYQQQQQQQESETAQQRHGRRQESRTEQRATRPAQQTRVAQEYASEPPPQQPYSPRTRRLMEQSISSTNAAHMRAAERLMQIKQARAASTGSTKQGGSSATASNTANEAVAALGATAGGVKSFPLVGHMRHVVSSQAGPVLPPLVRASTMPAPRSAFAVSVPSERGVEMLDPTTGAGLAKKTKPKTVLPPLPVEADLDSSHTVVDGQSRGSDAGRRAAESTILGANGTLFARGGTTQGQGADRGSEESSSASSEETEPANIRLGWARTKHALGQVHPPATIPRTTEFRSATSSQGTRIPAERGRNDSVLGGDGVASPIIPSAQTSGTVRAKHTGQEAVDARQRREQEAQDIQMRREQQQAQLQAYVAQKQRRLQERAAGVASASPPPVLSQGREARQHHHHQQRSREEPAYTLHSEGYEQSLSPGVDGAGRRASVVPRKPVGSGVAATLGGRASGAGTVPRLAEERPDAVVWRV